MKVKIITVRLLTRRFSANKISFAPIIKKIKQKKFTISILIGFTDDSERLKLLCSIILKLSPFLIFYTIYILTYLHTEIRIYVSVSYFFQIRGRERDREINASIIRISAYLNCLQETLFYSVKVQFDESAAFKTTLFRIVENFHLNIISPLSYET